MVRHKEVLVRARGGQISTATTADRFPITDKKTCMIRSGENVLQI